MGQVPHIGQQRDNCVPANSIPSRSMREDPLYLILGSGRLSKNFQCYFDSLGVHYDLWTRNQNDVNDLHAAIARATHILVLLPDDVIEPFLQEHKVDEEPYWIHCSGALVTPLAVGAHPLMTFSEQTASQEVYQSMPFVIESGGPEFHELFPQLKNPHFKLSAQDKALYHALCVASGNFTNLLWNHIFDQFEQLGLPKEHVFPYLNRNIENIKTQGKDSLTGPLKRCDFATIEKNLQALKGEPLEQIYRSFLNFYQEIKP